MVESTNANTANDLLNFEDNQDVQSKLFIIEKIIFSCMVNKKNSWGWKQSRNLMLTNCRLHNLEKSEIKRSIELEKIKGITKNSKKGETDEFLVHVEMEYDY